MLFRVEWHSMDGGLIRRTNAMTFNDAQKVAAQFRRLPAKPRAYLVFIRPTPAEEEEEE